MAKRIKRFVGGSRDTCDHLNELVDRINELSVLTGHAPIQVNQQAGGYTVGVSIPQLLQRIPITVQGTARIVSVEGDGEYKISRVRWDTGADPNAYVADTTGIAEVKVSDFRGRTTGQVDDIVPFWKQLRADGSAEYLIDAAPRIKFGAPTTTYTTGPTIQLRPYNAERQPIPDADPVTVHVSPLGQDAIDDYAVYGLFNSEQILSYILYDEPAGGAVDDPAGGAVGVLCGIYQPIPHGSQTGDLPYWDQSAKRWKILPVGAQYTVVQSTGDGVGYDWVRMHE